ncbi:MAG: peptide chain release factor 1 [bacterium]|nr:peptide chain release factor 1 [bacterium]
MKTPSPQDLQKEIDALTLDIAAMASSGQNSAIKEVAQKLNRAKDLLECVEKVTHIEQEMSDNKELLASEDTEMKALAQEELVRLEKEKASTLSSLDELLIPEDPRNSRDVIMEIRAGAGGEEATLFAQELLRAYIRFAEIKGWRVAVLEEGVVEISGKDVYGHLRYESGVHRVQRIPETEKMGRTHTSTITVAILPAAEEVDVEIKPEDLRIDTYRASGAGGQHVNKTSSAIRITHIPTNTVVACQEERSQHKNREKAMSLLRSRILAAREEAIHAKEASARKAQIGTGDRSEKIRTYNFPQDRITDHRIKKSWSNIPAVMEGALDTIFSDLQQADRELRIAQAI